jgi:HEPN domain-containing protein
MSRIKKKNNTKFNSIDFLNFAVRNYISARILYLNNRLYDAGVMSHEAIEKVMKSILYFKDSELNFNDVHDLNTLKAILVKDFEYQNLIESKSVLMFYQNCYSFRYPDKKTPKSFAAATFDFSKHPTNHTPKLTVIFCMHLE